MTVKFSPEDTALIRQASLFKDLSEGALTTLLAEAAVKSMGRNETLFMQGDQASAFFIILEGWVKIYRLTHSGGEAVVGVFTRGQSFAEAVAFTSGVYPASAESVTDTRILIIPTRRLPDVIRSAPEIGLKMLASLSQHLHGLVHQVQQLKAHTGAQRLAEFLLSLAPVDTGACTIVLPYDKALIAGHLGMKPESLSRAFLRLREYGVRVKQNMATISDVEILRDFFEQERAEILRSRG